MTLDAIVVGLLCGNFVLLIIFGFTVSGLRNEVEYSTKQTRAEVNATREILLNMLRIAQDGTLSAEEVPQMEHLLSGIQRIVTVALEIQLYLDKRR